MTHKIGTVQKILELIRAKMKSFGTSIDLFFGNPKQTPYKYDMKYLIDKKGLELMC